MSHSTSSQITHYDNQAASFIQRLPDLHKQFLPQGYYRSKLFIAPFSTNPLVAAAGPLLSLLERLYLTTSLPPVNDIRNNIEHELQAFHSRISDKSYTNEIDAIAHYLLCATIDELVGKNYLRVYQQPAEFKAFTPSSYDEKGPEERFFDIVHYVKQRPNQYLDLVELAYYCLIAGFEGKQHGKADGRQVLDNLIEELYQLIQEYRVNKPHRLFNESQEIEPLPQDNKPLIKMGLIAFSLLIGSYFLSHVLLEKQANTVQLSSNLTLSLDD
ncbi:MAG: type IVB secretion system protein IcmH/DotU [Proteobacteria bacterium]|nr:type IVB secretion system protein IcmH/DotU [Pseudomonadota bacterium]